MIDLETGMKELAEAPRNTHNKRSLIRTPQVCHRRLAIGSSQQAEEYKYTHTYTHTHTHTHTHTCYAVLEAGIYLLKVSSRNSRTKHQIRFKLIVIEQRQLVVLVSFLLTYNRIHTLC